MSRSVKMTRKGHSTVRLLVKCALVMAGLAMTIRLLLALDDIVNEPIEPFSLEKHPYVPPGEFDSRSPCPALNTLANHGLLPHDGRGASTRDYIRALRQGYHLSFPLAAFITMGGHMLLSQYSGLSLSDLARHNCIEHDASLGHWDVLGSLEYAPDEPSQCLLAHLLQHSSDNATMSVYDFAAARVERESAYAAPPLDAVHSEIARGEMSMVLGIFGGRDGRVPNDVLKEWWEWERFPAGYAPSHEQTLLQTVRVSQEIKSIMGQLQKTGMSRKRAA